ncbi:MAG: hypothetical protein ACOCV4_01190 [Myxococcota bacterium]
MARAKAEQSPPTVEELYFRSESAYLCLLLNRRTKFIRMIDFRAGVIPAKRLYVQSVAKQEGITKVITLVEKDEISSWTRVGFVREGTVPGFYKRSDGHLCGCVIGDKTASIEVSDEGVKLTDRTINAAKKAAKDIPESIKGVTVKEIDAEEALSVRDQAWKKGNALGSFDPFGRDAERMFITASYRRGKTQYLCAEYQDCFGHSLIEMLRSPKGDNEVRAVAGALQHLTEDLKERGIVSAFSFAPNDDVDLATAFTAAGYRKTGLLALGVHAQGERKDAILWTRKLANPASGEDEG